MKRTILLGLVLFAILPLRSNTAAQEKIEAAVVRIVNQYNAFSWYTPWNSGSTGRGIGSGFVISKNRILTNAHVVRDTALLLVYFHNDPTPYPARVTAIGHDCDLAILELNDPSRMESVSPLTFMDRLPKLRSRVVTYGYPIGSKLLSSTVGVVSRIEMKDYVHSDMDTHLTIQTDAAINPGNSGGPVIQEGKIVGVSFQSSQRMENMGFFIPETVVNHFLTDLADGIYDGYPELGIYAATMENTAARRYAEMQPGETGIRVENLIKGCGAEAGLRRNDILTSINGFSIANDGTVEWNGIRIEFTIIPEQMQKGEFLSMQIVRGGRRMKVDVLLNDFNPLSAKGRLYNQKPTYFVYAGLVFVPLNRETIATFSNQWLHEAPQELVYEMYYRHLQENDFFDAPQVMIIRRLDHQVNVEESLYLYKLIDTVNGKKTRTLQEVIDAIKDNTAEQHLIRFQYRNRIMVLDRRAADEAHEEILAQYAIPRDRRL